MAVLAAAEVLDLTQDALAALVGCSKDLIVTIEGDARHPSRQVSEPLATPLQLAPRAGGFHPLPRAELTADRLPRPARGLLHPKWGHDTREGSMSIWAYQ